MAYRWALSLVALAALVAPAPARTRDKLVRIQVGPFKVDAERDREICQAIRVPKVAGMELAQYEVRSLSSPDGQVGSHHLVIYGYGGEHAAAFPTPKSPSDVADVPGCNGFGPDDTFRRRVQLAGSGGEFRKGRWTATRGQTPGGLATVLPHATDGGDDAWIIVNSHYFNNSKKRSKALVKVVFRLRPFDGSRRLVHNWAPLDASLDIAVPPGQTGSTSATVQLDGVTDENVEGGFRPDHDVCLLFVTTHTHKRGTKVTIAYEQDGQAPVTLLDPAQYDYEHPSLITFPYGATLPNGNLLKAYTAENGHPRLRYTCHFDNAGGAYAGRMGCEEQDGVTPGTMWRDALANGAAFGDARPCGVDAINCTGFGTGRCVPANLVFGPLSDDEMCVLPIQFYDPKPGVPDDQACTPF